MQLDPNEISRTEELQQPNCAVTPWGPWSECSSSCGSGVEVRSRRFEDRMGLKKCPFVDLTERRKCSRPACVGAEAVSWRLETRDTVLPQYSPSRQQLAARV